jgi:hypothetical protein
MVLNAFNFWTSNISSNYFVYIICVLGSPYNYMPIVYKGRIFCLLSSDLPSAKAVTQTDLRMT